MNASIFVVTKRQLEQLIVECKGKSGPCDVYPSFQEADNVKCRYLRFSEYFYKDSLRPRYWCSKYGEQK